VSYIITTICNITEDSPGVLCPVALTEELRWREEKYQRDLAYHLKMDHVAAVEQQRQKNWVKTFLLPSTPFSDEEMNLINLL